MSVDVDYFRARLKCLDKAWGFSLDDPRGIPCGDGLYSFGPKKFGAPTIADVCEALSRILPEFDDDLDGEVAGFHVYRLGEWEFEVLIQTGKPH